MHLSEFQVKDQDEEPMAEQKPFNSRSTSPLLALAEMKAEPVEEKTLDIEEWKLFNSTSTSPLLPLAEMRLELGQEKILVVDDDPDLRMGLEIRLRSNDYEVHVAEDATCAIQMARKHVPDLIILDLGLPDADGYFVMRALQQSVELARIPVIVLSGWNRFSHELLTQLVGARKFFQKPVDDRRLLQEIRRILR